MQGFSTLHFVSARLLFVLLGLLILPVTGNAQGSGRESTGNGGIHVIQGYVYFPSGRRAVGDIIVKLESYQGSELRVVPDSSGAFTFSSLLPGNYTVVVNAGNEYEVSREGVYIDTDPDLSRDRIRLPTTTRKHTVIVHLRPKENFGQAKASVVNAALAAVPEKARKLYEQGVEHSRANDSAKAADSLKEAVALYPNFPLALNELGVQYLKLRQIDKALEVLRQACKLDPQAFAARLNLGVALLESKKFSEAEEQLRESLKQNANALTAHMYLGITLLRLKKFEEAEKELLVAAQANAAQLSMANYYLGGLYWRNKDYVRAVEQLEKYLLLSPNGPEAERVRATVKDLRTMIPKS